MTKLLSISAKNCCTDEKERLMEILRTCDYCTQSIEQRHRCFRKAAKESGIRSKACLMPGV